VHWGGCGDGGAFAAGKFENAPGVSSNEDARGLDEQGDRLEALAAIEGEEKNREWVARFGEVNQRIADTGPDFLGDGIDGHSGDEGFVEDAGAEVAEIDTDAG
jgi:hypothetical protein